MTTKHSHSPKHRKQQAKAAPQQTAQEIATRLAGDTFLRAVLTHDLGLFQASYGVLRDKCGVDLETSKWHLRSESGDKVGSFTTRRLCLHFGSLQICEQNFRFSLFNEGSLLREPGPFGHIDGLARCLLAATEAGAEREMAFFGSLAERYVATLFQVTFNQRPGLLRPDCLLTFMREKFTAYSVVAPLIEKYQEHYEREWIAGRAPASPVLWDEMLDPNSPEQVLILR